jgi:predicted PurR-regulated permease PerM
MRLERQLGFWLGAFGALALFLYVFSSVLLPFVAGLILAYLFNPLADRLEKAGFNRLGASLLIVIVVSFAFVLMLILFVPVMAHQLAAFIESLPGLVTRLQALVAEEGGLLGGRFGGGWLERLGLNEQLSSAEIQKSLGDIVKQGVQWMLAFMKSLWSGGQALLGVFSLLVVTPVVAFYILLDWGRMIATIDGLAPPAHREDIRALARDMNRAIAGFLRGQSLVCLFLGLWYGIGLSLIGLKFGFLLGVCAGFLSFIPYVGSLTALVLSAVMSIVQGWPSMGLFAMAMGVIGVGQFLEGNVLTPRLVGASVGLHPVWLMFALFAFGSLFGFTGLILAVPVAAVLGVLIRFAIGRYRLSPVYLGAEEPH